MRGHPAQNIGLGVELLSSPDPLGKSTRPYPNLHVVHVLVAELTPQTHLRPQHVLLVLVGLHHSSDVLVVEVQPRLVVPIGNSQVVPHPHVQVEWPVLRNHDLVFGLRQSAAPPLNHVSFLDLNVVVVHPVDELLVGVQPRQNLVLLPAVMPFKLLLPDLLLQNKLRLVCQASQRYLVSSQVHQWVRENIEHFRKHLPYQLISLLKGYVQRTHETLTKSARDSSVLRSQPPASRMSRSVKFGHYPNPPPHRICNDLLHFFGCIGLLR